MVAIEFVNLYKLCIFIFRLFNQGKTTSYTRFMDYCDRFNNFLKQNKTTRPLI